MRAQDLNDLTYEETAELTENPEVLCRTDDGRLFYIVDDNRADRDPEDEIILTIKEHGSR